MYVPVLTLHSWLRWVVLLLGLWVTCQVVSDWLRASEGGLPRAHMPFIRLLDIQFLLGVLLYATLSPTARLVFAEPAATMADPVLRFFSIEHAFGMFVAVSFAHAGLQLAAKRDGLSAIRAVALTQLGWLVVTLVSIPWPFLAYGRPLFRL